MAESNPPPEPFILRTRPFFQIYLWGLTLLFTLVALGLLRRAIVWWQWVGEEPTLLALLFPVLLFFGLALWLGRWALFHSTAHIVVDEEGLEMRSMVATDALPWESVEGLHLQATSGNEAQLVGRGHRVTFPSGSAVPFMANQQMQEWISYKLGQRELEYGDVHFWGP